MFFTFKHESNMNAIEIELIARAMFDGACAYGAGDALDTVIASLTLALDTLAPGGEAHAFVTSVRARIEEIADAPVGAPITPAQLGAILDERK